MNEVIKTIQSRKSIRKFSGEPFPKSDLQEILKTGFSAPNAGNRQPWRVVIVKDRGKRKHLAIAAFGQSFIAQASVLLVVCAVPYESAKRYKENAFRFRGDKKEFQGLLAVGPADHFLYRHTPGFSTGDATARQCR